MGWSFRCQVEYRFESRPVFMGQRFAAPNLRLIKRPLPPSHKEGSDFRGEEPPLR